MFMQFTETGKPSSFPISTSHVMAYLRAPAEDEAMVKRLIARACAAFVKFTNGHCAAISTYEIYYDRLELPFGTIRLPVRPLRQGVDTAYALDEAGFPTEVEALGIPGDDRIAILGVIPSDTRDFRSVRLEVTVGYTDEGIPDDILAGIEQMVVHLYESRGSEQSDIPLTVKRLWQPYVRYSIGAA